MTKELTIYQVNEDSIDVIDSIIIEVDIREGKEASSPNYFDTPELDEPDEIESVTYEGVCIYNVLSDYFSDEELFEASSDLETQKDISEIKQSIKTT